MNIQGFEALIDLIEMGSFKSNEDIAKALRSGLRDFGFKQQKKPDPKPTKMYLYFVGREEQKLWITHEPPETYLYRAISQYIGQVEVLV
jgi:hypothetical protein